MVLSRFKINEIIKKLKKLNTYGFKLWLVGGALEGWETKDVDICIGGSARNSDVFEFMEKAREMGPVDLFYIKNELPDVLTGHGKKILKFAKSRDRGHPKAVQRKGKWIDGLFWMEEEFPKNKKIVRFYSKKALLIHNGTSCNN